MVMYVQTCKSQWYLEKQENKLICHLWRMLELTFFFFFLNLCSQTGDWTQATAAKAWNPNHYATRELPGTSFLVWKLSIKRKESSMYPFWYEPYFTGTKWLIRRGFFIDMFQLTQKNRISRPPFSTSNGSRQRSSVVANIMKGDSHKLCAFK